MIAHRGASAGSPGNSLEAFDRAIAVGADLLEFDVRRTADGRLVVFHDALVGNTRVGRLTREQIAERIERLPPLLEEVLDVAEGRVGIDVELKEGGLAEEVLAAIGDRFEDDELLVSSFHPWVVRDVKRRAPHVRAGLVLGLSNAGWVAPVVRARRCHADCVLSRRSFTERRLLAEAAEAGLPAIIWTINDEEGLRHHLADPRVRGVVTDVPELAVPLRDELYAAACSAQSR